MDDETARAYSMHREMINGYINLVRMPEGKKPFVRPTLR
jgi:hypothetical protein